MSIEEEFETIKDLKEDELHYLLMSCTNPMIEVICRFCSKQVCDRIYKQLSKRAIECLDEEIRRNGQVNYERFIEARNIMVLTVRFLKNMRLIRG